MFLQTREGLLGPKYARREVLIRETLVKANIPAFPDTSIREVYGVVPYETYTFGMFEWFDKKGKLSEGLADKGSALPRQRWAGQIIWPGGTPS